MRKNLIALGMLSLIVLVLAGCGNSNQSQTKNQSRQMDQNQVQNQAQNQDQKRDATGSQNGKGQAGPPEEARTACTDKAEGDSCSFTVTPRNGSEELERSGTCQAVPSSEDLVCSSSEMRGPGGPGGPINNADESGS